MPKPSEKRPGAGMALGLEPLLHLNLAISQRSDTGVRTEITIFCPTAKEIRRLATELNKLAEKVEKTYPNNDKQF